MAQLSSVHVKGWRGQGGQAADDDHAHDIANVTAERMVFPARIRSFVSQAL
jgi:hypothetical protein